MCKNGKTISVKIKGSDLRRQIVTNCGNCVQCRSVRAIDWSYRCYTEMQRSDNAYFVTLTIDDDNIKDNAPDKRDIQLFHKKLRQYFVNKYGYDRSLKYFLVSEYGYETNRLHYHAVYFNFPYSSDIPYIQINNEISRVWGKGIVYTKSFDFKQIAYCLKYLHKDKELANIQLSSKNLGDISDSYIRFLNTTNNMLNIRVRTGNGKTVALPRYFRKKFMTEDQKESFTEFFTARALRDQEDVRLRRLKRINFERENGRFMNNIRK